MSRTKNRGAARRHEEIMMQTAEARREQAASILAEGLVRLLEQRDHQQLRGSPVERPQEGTPLRLVPRDERDHERE